ncbi:hypothetical protein [Natronorubrum sp. FCH18a]|uniref:hypothetical protein n=1 Tax=Natronorubrum sp. FCH18a TaxID=3447018 RepID=UPI003F511302
MAPAIVHFLVGASLLLLLATPLALRFETVRRYQLWLILSGGLWGLVPDVHHVAPVSQRRLESLHASSWADLFAFHNTLDQPPLADMSLELIFGAILLFLVAITVFTAVGNRSAGNGHGTASESPLAQFVTAVVCVALAALIAGVVLGAGLHATNRLESVAALYGREGARAGAVLLLAWSVVTGAGIAAIIAVTDETMRATDPVAGISVGLLVAVVGWLFGIAVALPLWMQRFFAVSRPFPYLHWQSLIGLLVFGFVFGLCYSLLRRLVGPLPTENSDVQASSSTQ